MRLTLHDKRSRAGSVGGTVTALYGKEFYQQIGHDGGMIGGRPRKETLEELRAKSAFKNNSLKEERFIHRGSFINSVVMSLMQEINQ